MAKMWWGLFGVGPACPARGTWYWVSSTISLILRQWMPPASLASSNRILTAFEPDTPYVAAGPERSVCVPSTISVGLTPRVSAATATIARATMASTAPHPIHLLMSPCLPIVPPSSVRVHVVDQLLV